MENRQTNQAQLTYNPLSATVKKPEEAPVLEKGLYFTYRLRVSMNIELRQRGSETAAIRSEFQHWKSVTAATMRDKSDSLRL